MPSCTIFRWHKQKGQWAPGQYGFNAGSIPGPGVTYANVYGLRYVIALSSSLQTFELGEMVSSLCAAANVDSFELGSRVRKKNAESVSSTIAVISTSGKGNTFLQV